jgi:hypothetical protein
VVGTRSEKLVENAHEIRLSLAADRAILRVRRRVFNGGDRADQALFEIDLPDGAVATQLATLGARAGRPFWFQGELMEAEAAAAKYRELTGIGGHYPKDPALLSWRSQGQLVLQVFPCLPKANKWIEYTLEIPTRYQSGRYFVELPRLGTETRAAELSVQPERAGDRIFVSGEPVAPGSKLVLKESDEPTRVELERQAPPRIDAELVSREFGDQRVLTYYRVAAAPRLSATPKDARVVVVLDGSHSVEAEARLGAVRAARAYLSHFPGAKAEIVVFDRKLHPRYGRLLPVARALADLDTLSIAPRNGSQLDAALTYADTLLSREPVANARRILVLTDARTRSALTADSLSAALAKSGALLHVAVIQPGAEELHRDDTHPWSRVTRATGGLVWSASLSGAGDPAQEAAIFEEWARPKALDHVRLSPSVDELEQGISLLEPPALDDRLSEGEARDALGVSARVLEFADLEGELWTERVRMKFTPDERAARRWSALFFGTPLLDSLSEPEMMVLARHGGVVSPVTSYLAIEPGVRPSTEGLEWGSGGLGEGIGLGGVGTFSHCGAMGVPSLDRQKYLEELIKAQLLQCGGAGRSLTLELETTLHEVVDVPRIELKGAADWKLSDCVREGVWAFALPAAFTSEQASWTIRI